MQKAREVVFFEWSHIVNLVEVDIRSKKKGAVGAKCVPTMQVANSIYCFFKIGFNFPHSQNYTELQVFKNLAFQCQLEKKITYVLLSC